MTAVYNLTIVAGETLDADTLYFVYKDAAGAAINLTGYTARAKIRTTLIGGSEVISMTTENFKIILGGALGTVALVLSAADTAGLWSESLARAGSWKGRDAYALGFWDLELIAPGGAVKRFLQGSASIVPEATR